MTQNIVILTFELELDEIHLGDWDVCRLQEDPSLEGEELRLGDQQWLQQWHLHRIANLRTCPSRSN